MHGKCYFVAVVRYLTRSSPRKEKCILADGFGRDTAHHGGGDGMKLIVLLSKPGGLE